MEDKKELRKHYLKLRKSLSKESVENKSYQIIKNLANKITPQDKTILFYVPINNEVDVLPLVKDLYLSGKKILFPKVINADTIEAYIIRDLFSDFKIGAYNIPEPDTHPHSGKIDIAVVPGVVFGRDGHRIGYGKSYYDRFLKKAHITKKIGICFDFQLVKNVPHTDRDCQLDMIISENEIIIPSE